MAVQIVDALEVVDVEHDRGQRAALAASLARGFGALEEDAAVGQPGQRIDRGEPHQFALHRAEPLGGAQARVKLVGDRRLGDEIVGAAVERLAEPVLVDARRHQDHVDRPVAPGEHARLPAQLQSRHAGADLARGDERRDLRVGAHAGKRLRAVRERPHLVIARLEEARHEQPHGAARIDQHNPHRLPPLPLRKQSQIRS